MAVKQLDIDSYIGPGWFSKSYIRNFLKNNLKTVVEFVMSSLGGDLDTAIASCNKIAEHGDVLVTYTGFNASSSTIFGLTAKKSRIAKNSFYLVHKAAVWVDEWGHMNEDDLENLIEKLADIKDNAERITLQVANMYHEKTGKAIKDILNLMKKEKWLTADEAVEWGFVDEVYSPSNVENHFENNKLFAMMKENGLPVPEMRKEKKSNKKDPSWVSIMFSKIDELKPNFTNQNNIKMNKSFSFINTLLNVDGFESSDGVNFSFTLEQMKAFNAKLSEFDKAVTDKTTAESAKKTAETNLTNATTLINGIDETVEKAEGMDKKVEAVKAKLAEKPGSKAAQNASEKDKGAGKDTGEDWDVINELPHNKEADEN